MLNKYERCWAAVLSVILIFILYGCYHQNQAPGDFKSDDKIVEYSFKVIKSVDISTDAIYSVFGELYKQGKISETDKDKLIETGKTIREGLSLSREALVAYMWSKQVNENQPQTKQKVKNAIAITLKSFYQFKDEAEDLYKRLTGKDLDIPSVPMFETVVNMFIDEGTK